MFNKDIYRSYDIRGVVGEEFDAEEAYYIGRAYAQHTAAKDVVVARDMRESGVSMEKELVRGLTEGGVNVTRIGLATSPMFYFAVHNLQADGGLMVTASHNPAKYNGIKMTRAQAVPIGGSSGLMEIRDLVEKREWQEVGVSGVVTENQDVRAAYMDLVTKDVQASGLKVVADAGNGMVGMLLPEYFERVGGEAVDLYWELDGSFPNHEADPLTAANRVAAEKAVVDHKADMGVIFDGDGDRVFFVTEEGKTVPGDIATALIAQEVLKEQPRARCLYDLRASRATAEAIAEAGGKPAMSKVGHSNIKAQMREEGAVFAGEVSGHFYFTPWYAESALLAFGKVLRLIEDSGKRLSELVAPLLRYAKTDEINFEVEDKSGVLARLKEKYADADIIELDGVSVVYPDWWANVRASNTEPLLRLNMEADTEELLREKQAEITGLIES